MTPASPVGLPVQERLFADEEFAENPPASAPAPAPSPPRRRPTRTVLPAPVPPALQALADALPRPIRLGTSSWSYPGWKGLVWEDTHPAGDLSQHGLAAYAAHPLLRTVCIDRTFYRPLQAEEYAAYAQCVGTDFRFVVKAPARVTDALVRGEDGRGMQPNVRFLDPQHAVDDFVAPALAGLGERCGALVFQLSPLSAHWLHNIDRLLTRLDTMLGALPSVRSVAPDAVIAVEVRDGVLLTPALAEVLRRHGATYCVGVHAKLPPLREQLPMLRALWPGPLVCRWNYHRRHGAFGFDEAEQAYAPFDRLVDPDLDTRQGLARVALATATAGHAAYITISNKAEGSAPLSVNALAQALQAGAPT